MDLMHIASYRTLSWHFCLIHHHHTAVLFFSVVRIDLAGQTLAQIN